MSLNGAGYEKSSWVVGGVIQMENRHWLADVGGNFDNAKKVNDNTGQSAGYTERFTGMVGVRVKPTWFIRASGTFSLLKTQVYEKQAWHPSLGVGHDFQKYLKMRGQLLYTFPGTDAWNAVQGGQVVMTIPSPLSIDNHWFFKETVGIYTFHETVTNAEQATEQRKHRSTTAEVIFAIMYRF